MSKRKFHTLNFENVPLLDRLPMSMSLEPEIKRDVTKFIEFSQRIDVCLKFAWFSKSDRDSLGVKEDRELVMREGFLRASLAEFAELEGAIKRDIKKLGGGKVKEIRESNRPLLHSLRAIRNFAIHMEAKGIESLSREATLKIMDYENTKSIEFWLLSQETVDQLRINSDMKKYYSEEDRSSLRDWFVFAQRQWGVAELIRLGVQEYCEFILGRK